MPLKALSWVGLVFAALFGGSVLGFTVYMIAAGPNHPQQEMIGLSALFLGGPAGALVAVVLAVVFGRGWSEVKRIRATVAVGLGTVVLIGAIVLLGNAGVLAW